MHIEVLLIIGPRPNLLDFPSVVEWDRQVRDYLTERYDFKASEEHYGDALSVIASRINKEWIRLEVRDG